jgi:hypothetical protein
MNAQSQASANQGQPDQPPTPGGDPDQPPNDLPTVRSGQDKGKNQVKDKDGYGHIGNKDVPGSKDAPEPHQIY